MQTRLEGRYSRNFDTLSIEEQGRLGQAHVVVIGLGGLGGGVVEMLARAGVGHLTLIDGDDFDVTNLNRQLLSQEHLVGVPKATAAAQRVAVVNSEIHTQAHKLFVDENNLPGFLKDADVVMDCLDSIDTRFMLQKAAADAGVPIVSGAIAGVTGQVTTILPGDQGYALIYGKKSRAQSKGVETRTGNISYCALFVSSLQSSECVKLLLKRGTVLQNRLLIAELWSNTIDIVQLA